MQKYLPVLRNCPFFTGLTDDEILSILHCVSAAKITRPRGSYIFRAGGSTADFLCVERAAMSAELSKLQKEGLLVTKRDHFELLTR